MIPRQAGEWVRLLALVAGGTWLVSCSDVSVTAVEVGRLEVTPASVELIPGETARLRSRVTAEDGSELDGRTVTWTTLDPEVAAVSSAGMVTAVGPGETTIRATAEGVSGSASVTVGPGPEIALGEESLTLSGMSGGPDEHAAAVAITNSGGGTLGNLEVSLAYDSDVTGWLEAKISSTTAPAELTLVATTSELGAGTFHAEVAVSSPVASNSPRTVAVSFEVEEGEPRLRIRPSPVAFTATEDEPFPAPVTLQVTNAGGGQITGIESVIEYEVEGQDWLSATLGSTTAPTELVLSVDVEELEVDDYVAAVIVSSDDAVNSPVTVDVTLTVGNPPPEIDLSQSAVEFAAFHEGANPDPETIGIENSGGLELTGLEASVAYDEGEIEWLTAELDHTQAPATLTLRPATAGLLPGTYGATMSVASDEADNSPQTVDVTFRIDPRADLAVSKSGSASTVQAGGRVTYTVTVSNAGPSEAPGVTVAEEPDDPLTFRSADPSTGSFDEETGIWSVGSLPPSGQSETLTLVFDVSRSARAPLENVVRVSSDVTDHVSGNDEDTETTVVAPPRAPSELSATVVSESRINLSWSDNSTNEDDFQIQRSDDGGSSWTTVATPDSNTESYADRGLPDGTTFTYRVRARNGPAGPSDWSNKASGTTPLSGPTELTAEAVTPLRIDLEWTDNSASENSFEVQRSTDGGDSWTTIATPGADTDSYSDTGLDDGTSFTYRVRARNADAGNSDWSNEASATTPLAPPTELSANAVSTSRIDLSWTDNSGSEDGFEIQRSDDGGSSWNTIATPGANTESYSDTDLQDGTIYTYRVRVQSAAVGESDWSKEASATTPLPAPSSLSATAVSPERIELVWIDNSLNESGFEIQRRTGEGSWSAVATTGANATSYSDTDREDNTTYTYRVRAVNAAVASTWSNEASATTLPDDDLSLTQHGKPRARLAELD